MFFGSRSKGSANQSSGQTAAWKPPPPRSGAGFDTSRGNVGMGRGIRGSLKSFGRAITDAAVSSAPAPRTILAPRSHVDLYDMVRRLRANSKTDFMHTEFAWWWKQVLDNEKDCFENVFWLMEIVVVHLKQKPGNCSQDVLALVGNTAALLFLYGYLNLSATAEHGAIEAHGKLMTLLSSFDDKEARDRTAVEMCVVDLIVKIKNAGNGMRRPLYTDLQDYTSFGSLDAMAATMANLPGGGGGAGAAAAAFMLTSKSWFDMPEKHGFSFFWPRLVASLDEEEEMNEVFKRVKSFLERHGESLGSTSRVQILVLIMMLREFITMRPTADVNWLCATIEAIKPYYQWPRPYSLIARQLLEDLSRECICPGSALRRRLRLEHPDLTPVDENATTEPLDSALTIGDLTPGHGMVHVMFDQQSPLATTYKHCFDLPQLASSGAGRLTLSGVRGSVGGEEPESKDRMVAEVLLRNVKESILLQMLSFEFDLSSEVESSDPLGLNQHDDATVDGWYRTACAVEKKAEGIDFGSFGERIAITKIVRESMLSAMLTEIVGRPHSFRPLRCPAHGHASTTRRPSVLQVKDLVATKPGAKAGAVGSPSAAGAGKGSSQQPGSERGLLEAGAAPGPPPAGGVEPAPMPEGFTRVFQLYTPNLDFRFWPTDSRRTPTWGGLDSLRENKRAAASGKGRLRQSASNLVRGDVAGAFNVVRGAPRSYVEDEFGEAVAESPGPAVLYFPEDVDILEHLAEAALDAMSRQSSADLSNVARSSQAVNPQAGSNHNSSSASMVPVPSAEADASLEGVGRSQGAVKPVVKLVVLGDNATVHRFVLAFFAFQRLNPNLFQSVRMQVYLVPLQERRNDIAKTISMNDPWYQRHVFAAFAGGLNLAPRFNAAVPLPLDIATELKIRDVLPVQRLQSLLQDYTRIATQELPIVAFECQCWTPGGALVPLNSGSSGGGGGPRTLGGRISTATSAAGAGAASGGSGKDEGETVEDATAAPDLVIPFVTSAQIGLMVDVQLFRKGQAEARAGKQAEVMGSGSTSGGASSKSQLKDVFKDESFAQSLMPWKPKDLIVVASPPTMHDTSGGGGGAAAAAAAAGGGGGGAAGGGGGAGKGSAGAGVAAGKSNSHLLQNGASAGGKDGAHAPSAIDIAAAGGAEGADGASAENPEMLMPKKYTTLLFTNVAGCVSDEILAEELESLEADRVKALTGDPIFGNSPTQRDLKMHAREWDGPKAGKAKELLSQKSLKGGFRGDPAESLVAALREEIKGADAVQKQVGSVSIEAAESKDLFGIMLDGVVHGPFKRVVITPMYLDEDTDELAKVPFMTFLPQT